MQHVGPSLAEGEHGDGEDDQKHGDLGRREAEGDFLSGGKPNGQSSRNSQADGGQNRAEENVDRALQLVVKRGLYRGEAFRGEDEGGDNEASKGNGQTAGLRGEVENAGQLFGQKDHGDNVDDEEYSVEKVGARGFDVRVQAFRFGGNGEKTAVAARLHDKKDGVDGDGKNDQRHGVRRRKYLVW